VRFAGERRPGSIWQGGEQGPWEVVLAGEMRVDIVAANLPIKAPFNTLKTWATAFGFGEPRVIPGSLAASAAIGGLTGHIRDQSELRHGRRQTDPHERSCESLGEVLKER
jgi:hypothetical protein